MAVDRRRVPLGRLGLRFVEPGLEAAFRQDYGIRILKQVRVSLVTGAILYLALGMQDMWFFPDHYGWVWGLRAIIAVLLGLTLAATYRPRYQAQLPRLLIPATIVAGAGPIIMISVGSWEVFTSYYLGLTLVIVWVYTFSGLRLLQAMAVNAVLIAAYLLVAGQANAPLLWLATNTSNLLAASLLVGFAAYLIEHQRRELFYQATLLQAESRSHAQLALSDHLTGLPNRVYFERRFQEALHRARRHEHRLAVIFVDIDDFKPINDRYGHRVGDNVLAVVARSLEEALRANDTVARIGGDEFVVLVEEVAGADKVAKIAAKLRQAVDQPVAVRLADGGQAEVQVSASIGSALFPDHADSVAGLLEQADIAMYRDKQARRQARQLHTAVEAGYSI